MDEYEHLYYDILGVRSHWRTTNIWRPRENRYLLQCSVRVEFPRELCGRMEDGECDVAIERRTDEGEDDCDRGYQD